MSDSFDSLLARTEHRDAGPLGPCPDAEVLAAYLDATLAPSERAVVETHAADCARCALQLATIVRLEDVSGSPQHARARRWWPRLAWMVPAATAVLVAAIYVSLPSEVAPTAPAAPITVGGRDEAALKEANATPRTPESDSPASPPSIALAPLRSYAPTAKTAPQFAPTPPASEPVSRRDEARQEDTRQPLEGAAAQSTFVATREIEKAEGPAAATATPAAAAPPESLAESSADAVAQGRTAQKAATRLPLVIRAPDANVQWRVIDSRIDRSSDGGQTWSPERAPLAAQITMGAAPSSDVCWMAARSGTVLRRGEDGAWLDVSPAPRLTITRLEVTGSLDAVVVGPDGTAARTTDGGRTWSP